VVVVGGDSASRTVALCGRGWSSGSASSQLARNRRGATLVVVVVVRARVRPVARARRGGRADEAAARDERARAHAPPHRIA